MKNKKIILFFLIVIMISSMIVININKRNGYYIGKIESIQKNNEVNTLIISPIKDNPNFTSEIKTEHKIEYKDDITIVGLKEKFKKRKELYMGQLDEIIDNLKVGDSIIFKVKSYDKGNYRLDITELAVDLTLD